MTLSSAAALSLTLGMAAASFRWLESPFLRLKQQKFTYVPSGPVIDENVEENRRTELSDLEEKADTDEASPEICPAPIAGSLESAPIEP